MNCIPIENFRISEERRHFHAYMHISADKMKIIERGAYFDEWKSWHSNTNWRRISKIKQTQFKHTILLNYNLSDCIGFVIIRKNNNNDIFNLLGRKKMDCLPSGDPILIQNRIVHDHFEFEWKVIGVIGDIHASKLP